jgi:hypothetical protein
MANTNTEITLLRENEMPEKVFKFSGRKETELKSKVPKEAHFAINTRLLK